MSTDTDYKTEFPGQEGVSKLRRFENKLTAPFQISVNIGSTFFLIPAISREWYEGVSFDWLWFHVWLTVCI